MERSGKEPGTGTSRPVRASDQDSEAVVQRLQAAFAEGRLDDDEFDQRMRAAELTAHETAIIAIAYKSRIDILVPPGMRVEMEGFGVTKGWSPDEELESGLPRDAPVVHIRGIAYKGTIEASTRPPGRDAGRPAVGR